MFRLKIEYGHTLRPISDAIPVPLPDATDAPASLRELLRNNIEAESKRFSQSARVLKIFRQSSRMIT